jgi:hypothetical protein
VNYHFSVGRITFNDGTKDTQNDVMFSVIEERKRIAQKIRERFSGKLATKILTALEL